MTTTHFLNYKKLEYMLKFTCVHVCVYVHASVCVHVFVVYM